MSSISVQLSSESVWREGGGGRGGEEGRGGLEGFTGYLTESSHLGEASTVIAPHEDPEVCRPQSIGANQGLDFDASSPI